MQPEAQLYPASGTRPSSDDACAGRVLTALRGLCGPNPQDSCLCAGELVIRECYGGSLEVWREKGPKTAIFRKLIRHPELPLSPSALYRAVAVFELRERFAGCGWQRLGASHFRSVIGLTPVEQQELLHQAEQSRWTAARLEAIASKYRLRAQERRGRPPLPRFVKVIHQLKRLVARKDQELTGFEALPDLAVDTVLELRTALVDFAAECHRLQQRLDDELARRYTPAPPRPPPGRGVDLPQ